jgi:hypothetical protein
MAEGRCETCRFWECSNFKVEKRGKELRIGLCLRYPPQITDDIKDGRFPRTAENAWCGEFKPKNGTEAGCPQA